MLIHGKNISITVFHFIHKLRDLVHLIYKMSVDRFRLEIRRKILSITEMRVWNGCCLTRVRTEILVGFKMEIDTTWIYGSL